MKLIALITTIAGTLITGEHIDLYSLAGCPILAVSIITITVNILTITDRYIRGE